RVAGSRAWLPRLRSPPRPSDRRCRACGPLVCPVQCRAGRRFRMARCATLALLFALAAVLLPSTSWAQTPLTPTGRLRVGLVTNGITAAKDPTTGELRGVGVELARA